MIHVEAASAIFTMFTLDWKPIIAKINDTSGEVIQIQESSYSMNAVDAFSVLKASYLSLIHI